MESSAQSRRHRLGIVFLVAAVLWMTAGLTVFESLLRGSTFIVYWLSCCVLTGSAMVVALVEIRALRRQVREQQRELLEETMRRIRRDRSECADDRKGRRPSASGN